MTVALEIANLELCTTNIIVMDRAQIMIVVPCRVTEQKTLSVNSIVQVHLTRIICRRRAREKAGS